jgi:hypothetical protein
MDFQWIGMNDYCGSEVSLTDHPHDLLDQLALIKQAVTLLGVLLEDLVEGAFGGLVRRAILLVLLAGICGAILCFLGLLHGQTEGGLTVEPRCERLLHRKSHQSQP